MPDASLGPSVAKDCMERDNPGREKKDNSGMSHPAAPANALLQVFDEDALRGLGAATVEVKSGEVLQRAGAPEDHAYFPINAVISLVSTTSGGGSVEVSMVGREGVAGLSGMFAADSPTENIVELGGTC